MKNQIVQVSAWWGSISRREQRLVSVCAALLMVGILYWGLLQPLNIRTDQARASITSEQQLLNWVRKKADNIVQLRRQGGLVVSNQPFNQILTESTRRFKIELIRIQPKGDMLQVWVQPLPFSQMLDWIAYLKEKHGIRVEFMDISRGDKSGLVEVKRLQFARGA